VPREKAFPVFRSAVDSRWNRKTVDERLAEIEAEGWSIPRVYGMTGTSGTLGPKREEGDGQVHRVDFDG